MKISRKTISLLLGIPLSIFFLILAFQKVDLKTTWEMIKETNYIFIIPSILIVHLDFSMRAFRWLILVKPIKKCKFMNLLSNIYIGFLANTTLPMRAGEFIRVIHIAHKENMPRSSAMATVIIERVLDVCAMLILLFMTFLFIPYPALVKKMLLITIILISILIAILYGLMYFRGQTLQLIGYFIKYLPLKVKNIIESIVDSFIDGLEILKKTHHLFLTLVITVAFWVVNASLYYLVAKGMGINEINYFDSIFIMAVIALGISIPSSPGFIGVYEYFGVLACSVLGIEKSRALSFILLSHSIQIILILVMGSFFLAKEHVSIFKLKEEADKEL